MTAAPQPAHSRKQVEDVMDGQRSRMAALPLDVTHIALALVRRPQDIPRYLSQGVRRTSAIDLGVPWFSYSAIDLLTRLIRPEWIIAEYGSGGSTIFLAGKAAEVITAEHDPSWVETVTHRVRERGLGNVEIRAAAADFSSGVRLAESPFARVFDDLAPDCVVIDSWTDGGPRDDLRPALFDRAERTWPGLKAVVVDDSWRYPELRVRTRARRVLRCQGVGPSRRRVTSTDIFLYEGG